MKSTVPEIEILKDNEASLEALQELSKWAREIRMAYAWVNSHAGKGPHWRALKLQKVTKAAIGIHFGRTEPEALKLLAVKPGVLGVLDEEPDNEVFHPKVLIGFGPDGQIRIIMGSSNLTAGGFRSNTELNVVLEGTLAHRSIRDVVDFVERQWQRARPLSAGDADWFAWYEEERRRWAHKPETKTSPPRKRRSRVTSEDLSKGWSDYYRLIRAWHGKPETAPVNVFDVEGEDGSYLQELAECQAAFRDYPKFASMPEDKRELILGFSRADGRGYLGRMRDAHRDVVLAQSKKVGQFLDQVNLEGGVKPEVVLRFLGIWKGPGKVDGVGMGTATRLLAVKRPDLFFPVNGANEEGLRDLFEKCPTTPEAYLELVKTVWHMPWCRKSSSAEVKGQLQREVWNARVALLDLFVYRPTERKG